MDAVNEQVAETSYTLHEIAAFGLEAMTGVADRSLADLEMLLAQVAKDVAPALPLDECRYLFGLALRKAIAKHLDLPLHLEPMLIAAVGILPNVHWLSWDEYVEALYCIAKYADFLQPARDRSLWAQPPAGAHVQ